MKSRFAVGLLAALFSIALSPGWSQTAPSGLFKVKISPSLPGPVSGRVLIFMNQGQGDKTVDVDQYSPTEFHPESIWLAAKEIRNVQPGESIELNANDQAFPRAFSQAPAGQWEVQAVLDVEHNYNRSGRTAKDWQSNVVSLAAGAVSTELTLTEHSPVGPYDTKLPGVLASVKPEEAQPVDIQSSSLTQFWGKPTSIHAWVILPPNYDANCNQVYPTVYWTSGFSGNMARDLKTGLRLRKRMDEGKMPPMVWVMLDQSVAQGTHEFADSVNNGPWGAALTTEFIPEIEKRYRLDAHPNARFLTGKSSGGWTSLQLEINCPHAFGGSWPISPDPSDFHDFNGVDLYAPNANVYQKPDGTAVPVLRDHAKS